MKYFSIAGISTAIDDSTKFGRALCDYFQSEEVGEAPARVEFAIRAADNKEIAKVKAAYTAVSGKFRANKTEFSVKERYYTYAVRNLFIEGETTELSIAWTRKGTPKNALRDRATAKTIGLGSEEARFLEATLNYTMFWTIFALVLLKNGKLFVHAGIFTVNGRAHVAAGSAGCGKTSTLLGVLENGAGTGGRKGAASGTAAGDTDAMSAVAAGGNAGALSGAAENGCVDEDFGVSGAAETGYVDEDFGVLGADGNAWYVPKRVTVYEEDAAFGSELIRRALATMSAADRRAWNFYKTAGVNMRYKFRPEIIFPGQVVKCAPIEEIDFVTKAQVDAPVRRAVSAEVIAEKLLCASFREMKMLYELLNNIRAVGDEEMMRAYPSVHELEDRYREVMLGIVRGCGRFCVVETPFKVAPEATIACLLAETGL